MIVLQLLISTYYFSFQRSGDHRDLHSFPTRRSSDLPRGVSPAATASSSSMSRSTWAVGHQDLTAHVDLDMLERSEEHTSELQSRRDLVCRLLLEKKKTRHPPLQI